MMKSLFAGAAALALIASAAGAQEAYDSTTTRTTTVTAPVPVVPVAPVEQTTTVQRTVNPTYFDPSRSYHEEQVTTQDGVVVQKTEKNESSSPYGTHTSTYTQTTTAGDQ